MPYTWQNRRERFWTAVRLARRVKYKDVFYKAFHGGKAKNDRIDSFKIASLIRGGNFPPAYVYPKEMRAAREHLKNTFPDTVVQKNIDLDMVILDCYAEQLSKIEWFIETQARQHKPIHLQLLKSISGVGRILSRPSFMKSEISTVLTPYKTLLPMRG